MRKFKRACALLLTGAILLGTTACGSVTTEAPETTEAPTPAVVSYTAKPTSVRKAETVYVNLDNSGKKTSVQVSDWLHTDKGEVAVSDRSNLSDIVDINGTTTPVKNGENLTWNMATTDLYYKGTSDKALPVEFSIEYMLNGKKISPEKIAGKKGDVEVRVTMKNTCKKDGVFLPVVCAGLMILPENTYTAIEVENGMTVGDGAKQIVLGLGVPGMRESLGLKDSAKLGNISLADSFTVRAKTECFELDNLYLAVLPICSLDLGNLLAGSSEEASAFFTLVQGLFNALGNIDKDTLATALSADNLSSISSMISDTISLYQKNAALMAVLAKYATAENLENIGKLITALQDPKTVKMLEDLNNPLIRNLLRGMPELLDATTALLPVMNAMQEDLKDPEIRKALEALPETLQSLSNILQTLSKNSAVLEAIAGGTNSSILGTVSDVLTSSDANTIITDLVQNADEIMPELESYIEFGKSYGLYTDFAEGTDISLLFVYMTPSLHAPVDNSSAEPTTQSVPWYKKIF